MEHPETVRVVRDAELLEVDPTSGMLRRRTFEAPGHWAGEAVTEPGALSDGTTTTPTPPCSTSSAGCSASSARASRAGSTQSRATTSESLCSPRTESRTRVGEVGFAVHDQDANGVLSGRLSAPARAVDPLEASKDVAFSGADIRLILR